MENIYLTAYGDFNDYAFLKKVCDHVLEKIGDKNPFFNSTCGIKNGDKICMKYVLENGYEHKFLKPRDFQTLLRESSCAILFDSGSSKGIALTLKQAAKLVSGDIYVVYPNLMKVDVYSFGEKPKTLDIEMENANCKFV